MKRKCFYFLISLKINKLLNDLNNKFNIIDFLYFFNNKIVIKKTNLSLITYSFKFYQMNNTNIAKKVNYGC